MTREAGEAPADPASVAIAGTVLPGPLLLAPYANDARCVAWAAGHAADQLATASGAVPFLLRSDDGTEVQVEPAGSAATLPVRLRFAFDRAADGMQTYVANVQKGRSQHVRESHAVGWIAVGDRIVVEATQTIDAGVFRGVRRVQATAIRADAPADPEVLLEVLALEGADPEVT